MRVTVWRPAATSTLLPALPGRWRVIPWVVHAEPVGWFTRALVFSLSKGQMKVGGVVQFLAVPVGYWIANVQVDLSGHGRSWPQQMTPEETNDAMRQVAELALAEAIPFFDAHANLDSRLDYLNERVSSLGRHLGGGGWQDVNVDEELAYVHILRHDLSAARTAARWSEQAAAADTRPWATEANERTQRIVTTALRNRDEAIGMLEDQARSTRAALKLPLYDK
jgi:hypothetical protein